MKFTIEWLKEHLETKFNDQKIIDKLMFDGKIKTNPITNDTRTFFKKPSAFDL